MGNGDDDKKKLMITVLIILLITIFCLIVGIIIVNFNKPKELEKVEDEESAAVYEGLPEEIVNDIKLANEAEKRYDDFDEKVQAMLNETPVDEDAVKNAYLDAIQYELSLNNEDWVYEYLMHASGVLGKKNHLYQIALDVFGSVDISGLFADPDLYRVSDKAVVIAEGANNQEARGYYEGIRKSAEAEYLREAEVTRRNVENQSKPTEGSE